MARITVEDCLEHVENRFQLVLLASKRARQLITGVEPLIDRENDKPTVVALREIARGLINSDLLDRIDSSESAVRDEDDLTAALQEEISRELGQLQAESNSASPIAESDSFDEEVPAANAAETKTAENEDEE